MALRINRQFSLKVLCSCQIFDSPKKHLPKYCDAVLWIDAQLLQILRMSTRRHYIEEFQVGPAFGEYPSLSKKKLWTQTSLGMKRRTRNLVSLWPTFFEAVAIRRDINFLNPIRRVQVCHYISSYLLAIHFSSYKPADSQTVLSFKEVSFSLRNEAKWESL